MKLLMVDNYKTRKGESQGYLTAVLHLAPHTVSGWNMCARASAGCSAACLNTAGKGVNPHIQLSRIRRTEMYVRQRDEFIELIESDLEALARKAEREGLKPACRLNATSDQPKFAMRMAERFRNIQFYDYTKIKEVFDWPLPANYYPTFSRSETNWNECLEVLGRGGNVAAVFQNRPDIYHGFEVVNGDESDLRFLDKRGVIVGLTVKGKGKKDQTGFVTKRGDRFAQFKVPGQQKEMKEMSGTETYIDTNSDQAERTHVTALRQIGPLDTSPEKLDEATQRELVLRAVSEKYGSLDGIKRRVGFPMWFDMTELLAGMTVDYLIRKESRGDLTAYFLYADKPLRFWRIGDGRIDFEKDPNFVPRDEKAKAEELGDYTRKMLHAEAPAGGPDDIDDDDEDLSPIGKPESPFVEKAASQNGASSEGKKKATARGPYKKAAAIDKTLLEQLAETRQNTKAIAAGLGVSQSHLYKEFEKDPKLRDVYDRGRRKFAQSQGHVVGENGGRPRKPLKRPEKQADRPVAKAKEPDLDIAEVERLAREGKTAKQAAAHFKIQLYQFKNRLSGKSPASRQVRDAWYRGKKSAGTPTVSNKSKPAAKAVRRSVKEPVRANKPEAEETIAEIIETGKAVAEEIAKESLSFELKFLGPDGKPIVLYELAETLGFNVGNALLHVAADEIEAASWYLDREKTRRERVAA